MTSEPERLSDERLAKFRIGHPPWNEEVIRMARELIALRAERAKDAKGWECVRILLGGFDDVWIGGDDLLHIRDMIDRVRKSASEAGIQLDE